MDSRSTAHGRIVAITGANTGIGFATAIGLARQGAHIAMICRDAARGHSAMRAVAAVASSPPDLFIADLASQESIRELVEQLHRQLPRIDVLINNAGAAFATRAVTVDGIERTFAVNHLAPFLLTTSALDLIRASSQGRIINVTAGIPVPRSSLLDNLQGERRYTQFGAYRTSKVSNILFTYELARRLEGTAITVNCAHPGPVRTEFMRTAGGALAFMSKIAWPLMKSAEAGARTPIYLASAPDVAAITGGYFVNCRRRRSASITYDRGIAAKLWEISDQLTRSNSTHARAIDRC